MTPEEQALTGNQGVCDNDRPTTEATEGISVAPNEVPQTSEPTAPAADPIPAGTVGRIAHFYPAQPLIERKPIAAIIIDAPPGGAMTVGLRSFGALNGEFQGIYASVPFHPDPASTAEQCWTWPPRV